MTGFCADGNESLSFLRGEEMASTSTHFETCLSNLIVCLRWQIYFM
jgi:hypothetical protein